MKFTTTTEMTLTHGKAACTFSVRINYDVTPPRAQTWGQPAEAASVGEMDFEVMMSRTWIQAGDEMHDLLLEALGDDLQWLIDAARDKVWQDACEAADMRRDRLAERAC